MTSNGCFPFFFNFYFYFILLYNIVLVLPYIDMNPPRVYMRSQTWTPLLPPSKQWFLKDSLQCGIWNQMSFLYSVTLKYISVSWILNGSFNHVWFCISLHWSFEKYCHWVIWILQMFTHFSMHVITTNLFLLIYTYWNFWVTGNKNIRQWQLIFPSTVTNS